MIPSFTVQEEEDLAKQCEICGKGKLAGNLVSHSNIKTHRRWEPNLRAVNATVEGAPRRLRVCTRCLRSGLVNRQA
jgi:large subunit ribosomal protein L28